MNVLELDLGSVLDKKSFLCSYLHHYTHLPQISKIWADYHQTKDGFVSGVIPSMHYAEIEAKGKICPRVRTLNFYLDFLSNIWSS